MENQKIVIDYFIQELKNENNVLFEKYKKKESEIDSYKKEIKLKSENIYILEQQVQNIPTLKNKIKDLERQASYELSKSSSYHNPLRTLNSANREIDYNKTLSSGNVIIYF